MFIADAERYFLTFTETPGEAQKIERICYGFAEKFSEDNPDLMDYNAACILSFLIMMCHSNLYNPNVDPRQKMTSEMFRSMAKEIKVDGQPLSPDYVKRVYDNIAAKPIAIHWSQKRKDFLKEAATANAKRKEELTKIENTKVLEEVNECLSILKEKKKQVIVEENSEREYLKISNINLIRPYLSTMWKELSAFFSILIETMPEDSDFDEVVKCAISLVKQADYFDMDQERDAFIMLFIQFSGLDLVENKELTGKNLYFIRMLVDLGYRYPDHLHKGWKILLRTVLKIDYLLSIAAGADKKARQELKDQAKNKNKQRKDIELYNCQQITTFIPKSLIDSIFKTPTVLDKRSVIDFFDSLCELARENINHRDFNEIIQRIVSVLADVTSTTRAFSDQLKFFETVSNQYVQLIIDTKDQDMALNFYCIDSLKQIIGQFLSRKETVDSDNQQVVLMPLQRAATGIQI